MAIDQVSPANGEARVNERTRIPMSAGQQKLSVPEIPGYHLHWMRGTADRIQAALNAGYEFVAQSETQQVNLLIGGDATKSGNTDMGTRVSVLAGGEEMDGDQPLRLYLMKLKEEWYQEDMKLQEGRSEKLRQAMIRGKVGDDNSEVAAEAQTRYVGSRTNTNMFQPKTIKRS